MGTKARDRKDLFPGALEMMILQTLQQQPLHGYGLVQHIQRGLERARCASRKARSIRRCSACSRRAA